MYTLLLESMAVNPTGNKTNDIDLLRLTQNGHYITTCMPLRDLPIVPRLKIDCMTYISQHKIIK